MFNVTIPDFSNKEVEIAYASTIIADTTTGNDKNAEELNHDFLTLIEELAIEHTVGDLENARTGFHTHAGNENEPK